MTNAQRTTLCPVLVADLAGADSRERLRAIAASGGRAFIPLLAAPVDGALHDLQVHAPGSTEPLNLRALPDGAPTNEGFPLRLFLAEGAQMETMPEIETPAVGIEPRRVTKISITERHTLELAGKKSIRVAESLIGRTLSGGKLHIESPIGTGGAGVVYSAIHRDLRMPVAVKVLHETFQQDIEFCRRFHAEALAASRLDHVNIVRVLDYGQEDDGLLYFAMEHLDGTPLSAIVTKDGALSTKRVVAIMSQVCAALAHAHAREVIHRDVKPENIVVISARDDDDQLLERVKVCDFGIAVVSHNEAQNVIAGTPAYMAPEQCRGGPIDGRTDVYACGVVLYELATGRVPFDDEDAVAVISKQLKATPVKPSAMNPAVDPRLEAIILKALAKDPKDRQVSMRALRAELRALVDSEAMESERTPVPRRASTPVVAQHDPANWLEHGSNVQPVVAASASGRMPAVRLGPWLKRFAEAATVSELDRMVKQLAHALPAFIEQRDVRTLFAIHSTLLMTQGADRLAVVRDLFRMFEDQALLKSLAETALARDDRDAARLLENIGVPATYALYSKRLELGGDDVVRRRFIEIVHSMGATALPMMRAGLTKLAPHRERAVACELAIDLLLATPNVRDEELGELAAAWARVGPTAVVRAALPALLKSWGERARPFFLAALASPDLGLATAAAGALRALGGTGGRAATGAHPPAV